MKDKGKYYNRKDMSDTKGQLLYDSTSISAQIKCILETEYGMAVTGARSQHVSDAEGTQHK